MNPLALSRDSRVMVLAAHPDDETLAAGGLLQTALAAGAAARVAFLTSGENNPWPQRFIERRWRLDASDRERWGALRRGECLRALETLGVSPDHAQFLGLPDQGLTDLLLASSDVPVQRLAGIIREWRPTHLAGPGPFDLHPDHSAAAVLTDLALARLAAGERPRVRVEYAVHVRASRRPEAEWVSLDLTEEQRATKLRAILCHASQLRLRPFSLKARSRATEMFVLGRGSPDAARNDHPVRRAAAQDGHLELELSMRPSARAFGRGTLHAIACAEGRVVSHFSATVPRRRHKGRFLVPRESPSAERIYVKIERRFGFFDEAGWRELVPETPR